MGLLTQDEIETRLDRSGGWCQNGSAIERTFKFKDFVGSIAFVNAVAQIAEKANHHPDIGISWNEVTMSLTTHSQGGLTESDFKLAAEIGRV